MVSALLLGCSNFAAPAAQPGETVRTLAALVPATVEGIVRDVTVLAGPDSEALAHVAEHAGCGFIAAQSFAEALRRGASGARSNLVLVARAGMIVDRGFIDEVAGLIPSLVTADRPPVYVLKVQSRGLLGRVFPSMGDNVALLTSRKHLLAGHAENFDQLVRRARPLRRFRTMAVPAA